MHNYFLLSVAIMQYLAEKYGKDDTFYPKDDLLARSIIHHRLAFYLSTYYRRVHDYMVSERWFIFYCGKSQTKYPTLWRYFRWIMLDTNGLTKNWQKQIMPWKCLMNFCVAVELTMLLEVNIIKAGNFFFWWNIPFPANITIADLPFVMATVALKAMDFDFGSFPCVTNWFEQFQRNHSDLWAVAAEGLKGLTYYNQNPRDLTSLTHWYHITKKNENSHWHELMYQSFK